METIFMNTENGKTNESHRFRLSLVDKLKLKDPNESMGLANLSIYFTWRNIKLVNTAINLKFLLQIGMINSICLMDHILLQISKTTLNLSSKNTKF